MQFKKKKKFYEHFLEYVNLVFKFIYHLREFVAMINDVGSSPDDDDVVAVEFMVVAAVREVV